MNWVHCGTWKIFFLMALLTTRGEYYRKCHFQYHSRHEVCVLEVPIFSRSGVRSPLRCAITCSRFQEAKGFSDLAINFTSQCAGFNFDSVNERCDMFQAQKKFKVWKSRWTNKSCVFYQKIEPVGTESCSLPEFERWPDIPGIENEDDGLYWISVDGSSSPVYCAFASGVTYLVFQRRFNGKVDFWRTWVEYENGFGNIEDEFWLGNKMIHLLTSEQKCSLRIDMESFQGVRVLAKYDTFTLDSAETNYTLFIGGYHGNAGDYMSKVNNVPFTTKDVGHDTYGANCAVVFHGAWWYTNCHSSNLNGQYSGPNSTYGTGLVWGLFTGFEGSLKSVEMKIFRNFSFP